MRWRASRPQLKRDPLGGTLTSHHSSEDPDERSCPGHSGERLHANGLRNERSTGPTCTGCRTNCTDVDPESSGGLRQGCVLMRNDGTRPIVIATLTLSNCVNTLQVCDVYHPNVAIAPGETVIVLRIQPLHPGRVYKFEFEYQWHT